MYLAFVMKATVYNTAASQYGIILFCQTEDGEKLKVYTYVAPMLKALRLQGLTKEVNTFGIERKQKDLDVALSALPNFKVNLEIDSDGKYELDFISDINVEQ